MQKVASKMKVVLLFTAVLLVTGCAVGNKYAYHTIVADITPSGTTSIAVASHDQRAFVTSGKKMPTFVGLQRGGFGNPFNVSTASRKALADDMSAAITASLKRKGYAAVPVTVTHTDNSKSVIAKLKATGSKRLIALTLNEWKSDTYQNVSLQYDVTMRVYDSGGRVLAEKSLKSRDNLGGSAWNPAGHARKAVPVATKEKLEALLNSPDIAKALR